MTREELAWQLALQGEYRFLAEPPRVQVIVYLHDGTAQRHPVSGYGTTTTTAARELSSILVRMDSPA